VTELWFFRYYDLIRILTISDLRIKYQSSLLGFLWSLLNPFLLLIVLYFVFSGLYSVSEDNLILYLFIGITAWRFFANATTASVRAILAKNNLVTKVFFPRKILVFSSLISSMLEFTLLLALLLFFHVQLTINILLFPLITCLYFGIVFGVGLAIGALYVFYRDLDQIWEVLLYIGFFLCPIMYPISLIPESYLTLYLLNPITTIMQMYRDILLYGVTPGIFELLYILGISGLILVVGILTFNRLEWRFAEEL
jgi:lipopolysaccharide transport system permease protein